MVGTSQKHRQPAPIPDIHDEQGVENWNPQNEDGRQEGQVLLGRVLSDHGQGPQHEADEHSARVAHVDRSGMPIVAEKAEQAADQRRQHDGRALVAVQQRDDHETGRADDADTRRQPIHDVEEIEGVDKPDHPPYGQNQIEPIRQGGDADPNAAFDENKDREHLADQLGHGREDSEIINESQHDDDGPPENNPQHVMPELKREGQAHEKRQIDCQAAQIRDRFPLMLQFAVRLVDDVIEQRSPPRERHAVQGEKQGKIQCEN